MKMNKISLSISTALLAAGLMTSSAVNAQGRLVVYCSATNILCETTTKAFGEKYDVKTSFIRNGSGSTFAKVEAEKNNPQADVWFGGTFDPQAQAAELGLIEPYNLNTLMKLLSVSVILRKLKDIMFLRFIWGS